jgi:dihydropteroate synthase
MSNTPTESAQGASPCRWELRGRSLEFNQVPCLMGIVNATPDSFSDGGRFLDSAAAVSQALRLVGEGADIIDVGGESTRPGAEPVSTVEELRRVVPVVQRIAEESPVLISIDTTKAEVAREALAAGAHIVNDISGLTFDPAMPRLCADTAAGVVCMHIRGTPRTMQADPRYDDVVGEIRDYLAERLEDLEQQGIPRERVALDPGIGFGKTAEHNIEILSRIGQFRELGRPVCIGHSRKRFLKRLLGREVDERLFATVGVAIAAAQQGAEIIRVHDVAAVRDSIVAYRAVLDWHNPVNSSSPSRAD